MTNKKSATMDLAELTKCADQFELAIMGDRGVGKSCFFDRFVTGSFRAHGPKEVSIFVDANNLRVTHSLNRNKISLKIWDSPSIKQFEIFIAPPLTTCTARGIILMYDCTNQESFDNINNWIDMLDYKFPETIPKLLVGNKSDLYNKKVVDYATAKEYADKLKMPFVDTSALRDTNVKLALKMMIAELCEKHPNGVEQNKELEKKEWQEMIQQTIKMRETMQQEEEQQKIRQQNRKLQEKEREEKERQEMLQVEKNALHERIIFRKMQQNRGETIAQYATRLKQQARICNFGMLLDENVRDQILGTCGSAKLTKMFFKEGDELTLEKLLEVGTLMESNAVDEQSTEVIEVYYAK